MACEGSGKLRQVDFSREEFDQRYARASSIMSEAGLGALLVTSEPNFRYLTGHRTQFWVSKSRPMFAVLAQGRRPIPLVTEIEEAGVRKTTWIDDIRTWVGFADDGLPVLAGLLHELGLKGETVGIDGGEEMRLGLPMPAFEKLKRVARGVRFVDGTPALWKLRQIKSANEIDYIRRACAATAKGLRIGFSAARTGMTEYELQRRIMIGMLEAGAGKVPFLPIHSGPGNYANFTLEPTDRRLRAGDMVWVDGGAVVNGYWSDFNRIAAVGRPTSAQRDAYRRIWDVTAACIDAVRPGIPISDVVKVRDQAYRRSGFIETGGRSGRMGHASGLDITEPPSVGEHDHTPITPGMVLHIEPKMILDYGFFQLEEVLAVTEAGCTLLSPRAPSRLPEIQGPECRDRTEKRQ
jgi:Xaa-Pro aminopeptidase